MDIGGEMNEQHHGAIVLAGVLALLEACINAPLVGLGALSDPEEDGAADAGADAAIIAPGDPNTGDPLSGQGGGLGGSAGPRISEGPVDAILVQNAGGSAGAPPIDEGDMNDSGGSSTVADAGALPCPSTVVSSPAATNSHGLIYDARRKLVLLVAGSDGPGAGFSQLHAFDTSRQRWARIDATGPAPSARAVPGFAYDPTTGRSVLFGGTGEPGTPRDLWEWDWDQCQWVDRTPAALPPEWPSFRWAPGMVYDYATQHVIITTGIQNPTYQWETDPADATVYEWDSARGAFNVRPPAGTPPFDRGAAVVVSDPHRQLVYLFSGLRENESPSGTGDTTLYVWDGKAGSWSQRQPSPAPSAREFTPAYFDIGADRLVMTGGLWYGWLWTPEYWQYDPDANAWALLNQGSIYNRFWSPIAYDEENAIAIQFGGFLADPVYYGAGPSGPVGDTRSFAGASVTPLIP
jgi:hypothetical protein